MLVVRKFRIGSQRRLTAFAKRLLVALFCPWTDSTNSNHASGACCDFQFPINISIWTMEGEDWISLPNADEGVYTILLLWKRRDGRQAFSTKASTRES